MGMWFSLSRRKKSCLPPSLLSPAETLLPQPYENSVWMVLLCLRSFIRWTHTPTQNTPRFSSNPMRLRIGVYISSYLCTWKAWNVSTAFQSGQDRQAHRSALGRSQLGSPPLFQLWNPSPVLRARGEAQCCVRPALLCTAGEAHQ